MKKERVKWENKEEEEWEEEKQKEDKKKKIMYIENMDEGNAVIPCCSFYSCSSADMLFDEKSMPSGSVVSIRVWLCRSRNEIQYADEEELE